MQLSKCEFFINITKWLFISARTWFGLRFSRCISTLCRAFIPISQHKKKSHQGFFSDAGDGTWTHTLLPASDFESDASAIPPLLRLINFLNKIAQARNILSYSKTDCKKFFDSCKNYFIHYFIRILEMKNVLWKIIIFRLFCWRKLSYMITY